MNTLPILLPIAWFLSLAQSHAANSDSPHAKEIATLVGHTNLVSAAAFSPDGSWLVTGGLDTTARLWDLSTGRQRFSVPGHHGGIWSIAFSPDGRYFLTGGGDGDNNGKLWNAESGRLLQVFPPQLQRGADWLDQGPLRRSSPSHGQRVEVVAFSPDGKRLLTGSNDGKVLVWETSTAEALFTLAKPNSALVHGAAFSPDGRLIAVASPFPRITLWSAANGNEIRAFEAHTNYIESLAYLPDSTRLVTASYDGTAGVWDVKTGAERVRFRGHRGPVMCVAVSPDGQHVVTGGIDATARLWETGTGKEILILKGHKGFIDAVAFSPDGRRVATTSDDGTIKLWDVVLQASDTPGTGDHELALESDYVPLAIRLPGDPGSRTIHSIRLAGNVTDKGDGAATIWLDTRVATLNAFGDMAQPPGPEPPATRVTLRRLGEQERTPSGGGHLSERSPRSADFKLYDVVFPRGAMGGRLRLALGTASLGPHRLLIYPTNAAPGWILPLRGKPAIVSPLPDSPLPAEVQLTGHYTAVDGRIRRLELNGTRGQQGTLAFDPNWITFDDCGEATMSTAMGYQRHPVTLRPLADPDPTGQRRTLYHVAPKDPANTNRVILVLSPTEAGQHRVLLYQGGEVAFIAPVVLSDRHRQETLTAELASASAAERQAVGRLRETIGHGFTYGVENRQITHVSVNVPTDRVLPATWLQGLTHVRSLSLYGGRISEPLLAGLPAVPALRIVHFSNAAFDPDALSAFTRPNPLESITFRDCGGISDQDVRHLTSLTNLVHLSFYTEAGSPDARALRRRITDAGLGHLSALRRLESLDLFGHDLTDASAPRLAGLTNLQSLALSGRGFTDTGLEKLAALPRLTSLRLYDTKVSTGAVAAIKARLPQLQIEAWNPDTQY